MRSKSIVLATVLLAAAALFAVNARAEDAKYVQPKEADAIQSHVDKAYQIANDDPNFWYMIHYLCGPKGTTPANAAEYETDHNALPPAKIFDQLYYLGMPAVGSWAITTSDGIILVDTLDNQEEAERVIEGGMRKAGLDPAQIKYIVLTHAHGDHYGGAKYLQEKYHAHVLMSQADWNMLERPLQPGQRVPPGWEIHPAHDMVIEDPELTLGNTTVTLYISPGHTPGTDSMVFHVTDHGTQHVAALMGGVAFPGTIEPTATSGGIDNFIKSNQRFMKFVDEQGIDVVLSPHPMADNTVGKLQRLVYYTRPGDPNPFVVGKTGAQAYYGIFDQCAQAAEERIKAKAAAGAPAQ